MTFPEAIRSHWTCTWSEVLWQLVLQNIPELTKHDWKRAVDLDTVLSAYQLRQAIDKFARKYSIPIPIMRYIRPLLIGMWSADKLGVDVT